jgi:hypothetical protein
MTDNNNDNGAERDTRRPALIGLLVVAVLVVIAYFVVMALKNESQREDCMMSGRTNCNPIEVPAQNR